MAENRARHSPSFVSVSIFVSFFLRFLRFIFRKKIAITRQVKTPPHICSSTPLWKYYLSLKGKPNSEFGFLLFIFFKWHSFEMCTKVPFFLLKPELSSCLFILFSCLVIFCFVAHRDDLSVITRGRDVIHQLHRNAVVTNNYNATNNKMNTSWRHAPLRRSRDNALNAFKVQTPRWWTTNKQQNNRILKSRISFLSLFSNPDSFQIQRVYLQYDSFFSI